MFDFSHDEDLFDKDTTPDRFSEFHDRDEMSKGSHRGGSRYSDQRRGNTWGLFQVEFILASNSFKLIQLQDGLFHFRNVSLHVSSYLTIK